MNKEIFASMRSQMVPSEKARAELKEKLAQPVKRPIPYKRYAAIAACAVLVIAVAVPVYREREWQQMLWGFQQSTTVETLDPHSYVLADGLSTGNTTTTEANVDSGGGDRDQKMTREELAGAMAEAGFSQEDIESYAASVWEMTWAEWWKFFHLSEESGERTLEALLDFSREELTVNTGDLPGGAFVLDIPSQEVAVMAYQNLRTQFEKDYGPETYPEWYGGAYINGQGVLIVNIVEDYEPEDKNLFLKIQDWAGSDQVGFGSTKYDLGYLRDLQDRAFDAMSELGLAAGCGVNEETGQVELDLSDVTSDALQLLAELDPADDAILVRVGQATVTQAEETLASDSPGGYTHIPAPAENDVQPSNLPANTEEAVPAEMIDGLPPETPVTPDGPVYDLLPLEPSAEDGGTVLSTPPSTGPSGAREVPIK